MKTKAYLFTYKVRTGSNSITNETTLVVSGDTLKVATDKLQAHHTDGKVLLLSAKATNVLGEVT